MKAKNSNLKQTTVTLPESVFEQVMHEAHKMGLSYNRYVVNRLTGRLKPVYDLQPVVNELFKLRVAMEKVRPNSANDDIRKEVLNACRYLELFLVEQIRNTP